MLKTDDLLINISLIKRLMKTILWVCVFVALGVCAVIDPPVPAPAAGGQVAPAVLCTVQTSIWRIYNYPVPGNTVTFQFQRRTNCKHLFKMSSPCTSFEVAYTTTHDWVGSPIYNINSVNQIPSNLASCTSGMAATLEGNIVNAFYPPPKSGWYHIFLSLNTLHWGGYVATWVSGPKKVWFS